MAVIFTALRACHSLPAGKFLVLIYIRGLVEPTAIAGRIKSIEKSSELIGNRNRDPPACNTRPHLTTLPCAPQTYEVSTIEIRGRSCWSCGCRKAAAGRSEARSRSVQNLLSHLCSRLRYLARYLHCPQRVFGLIAYRCLSPNWQLQDEYCLSYLCSYSVHLKRLRLSFDPLNSEVPSVEVSYDCKYFCHTACGQYWHFI
jgi:hypothetical protein